jgi:hypothetical protein
MSGSFRSCRAITIGYVVALVYSKHPCGALIKLLSASKMFSKVVENIMALNLGVPIIVLGNVKVSDTSGFAWPYLTS